MYSPKVFDDEGLYWKNQWSSGKISDEKWRDIRSARLRQILVENGELRPDQPGRPALVTAMLVKLNDN